jgi:hypothetical protein
MVHLHAFLTLTLYRGEQPASHPSHFTTEGRCQCPRERRLGNLNVCLNIWGREKCLSLLGNKPWVYSLYSHFTIIPGHFYKPVHSFTISPSLRSFTILTHLPPDFVTWFEIRCDKVVSVLVVKRAEGIPYLKAKVWGEGSLFHFLKSTFHNYNVMMAWENVHTLNFPENI